MNSRYKMYLQIPKGCEEIHHEVELGVVIGQRGSRGARAPEEFWLENSMG